MTSPPNYSSRLLAYDHSRVVTEAIGYALSVGNDLDPRAYVRMAARLRLQISEGTYPAAAPVPSITVLSEQYGHARQTCAKALQVRAKGFSFAYQASAITSRSGRKQA